jgi:hypothetical protein
MGKRKENVFPCIFIFIFLFQITEWNVKHVPLVLSRGGRIQSGGRRRKNPLADAKRLELGEGLIGVLGGNCKR